MLLPHGHFRAAGIWRWLSHFPAWFSIGRRELAMPVARSRRQSLHIARVQPEAQAWSQRRCGLLSFRVTYILLL